MSTEINVEVDPAATPQALAADNFSQPISDDIRALTEILTTPIPQTLPDTQHAPNNAAGDVAGSDEGTTLSEATVAAVAATVAAASAGLTEHRAPGALLATQDSVGHEVPSQNQNHPASSQVDTSIKDAVDEAELGSVASSTGFDVHSVYNQVLSLTSQNNQKPAGKRSAQEAFEQDQAARALQLIALSLSNPSSVLATTSASSAATSLESTLPITEAPLPDTRNQHSVDSDLKQNDTGASVSDTLMSISRAISFPTQATASGSMDTDTEAFTRAVITATQNEVNKNNNNNNEGVHQASSAESNHEAAHGLDQAVLQSLSLHQNNYNPTSSGAAQDPTSALANYSGQDFTFEVDKATGKTQIKWTSDPKDAAQTAHNALQDADTKAIHQALATFIANSGIPGLSDLSQSGSSLLAPPLGQFPVQGSEFGTAQDVVKPSPAHEPRKRKRPAPTSKLAHQNTAASIPEGSPSFPCEFPGCDKVFARLYNLKSHSRTHTDERPFVCSHCQLAFARNHDLKRHVRIHGGDKSFICTGCNKSFSRLDALRRHRANSKHRPGCENKPSETAETAEAAEADAKAG
ncbi:hypothetical protein EDD11_006467 [Mortierella claussenii]|nr:hypothetical protein EDD11_006467 [Mortierella claussenii]